MGSRPAADSIITLVRRRIEPEPPIAKPPELDGPLDPFDEACRRAGRTAKGEERFAWMLTHRHGLRISPREMMHLGRQARYWVQYELAQFEQVHGDGLTWHEMTVKERDDHPATHAEMIDACRRLADESLRSLP